MGAELEQGTAVNQEAALPARRAAEAGGPARQGSSPGYAPGYASGYSPALSSSLNPESSPGLPAEYGRMLYRHRRLIASLALAGALAGGLLTLGTRPSYRARTSLDIESLNPDVVGQRAVTSTGESGGSASEAYIQTQIKLLQSDTLLDHTVRGLLAAPHPAALDKDDLLSRWRRALRLPGGAAIPYDALLRDAADRVKVKPLGLTRLVEVTCDSWNAAFSARFCNALAERFREDDYATRGAEAAKTSEWLTRQVADVRVQAEQGERRLEAATGGNGLVLSQKNTGVAEDRLRQVQEELVRAEAERMEKQAQWEVSRSAPPESLPSVIDSPNHRALAGRLSELRGKVAELVPPLTEQNPKVIHLRSEIAEVEQDLAGEREGTVHRLRDEYDQALHRENLLELTYQAQEAHTSSELDKTNKVNLLRREVEGEQQLYQALLQKAKEAGFASAMQVSTIRVVDAAKPPRLAFAPRRANAIGMGFLLGALGGVALAFFRERTSGLVHAPGEAARLLGVPELGVIPSVARPRRFPTRRTRLLTAGPAAPGGAELLPPRGKPIGTSIWQDRSSLAAEAYRAATFSVLLASRGGPHHPAARRFVVSSPSSGDGKTTVVANLGVALSQSQRRVVLVDGDLRKPGLHKSFGLDNGVGLRNLLRGELDLAAAPLELFCRPAGVGLNRGPNMGPNIGPDLGPNIGLGAGSLFVITAGTGDEEATELLHSPRSAALLARLAREFDLVLVDTPPMLHMADARIFADHADGVILVLRAGVTSLGEAASARDKLAHDRVPVLGTILNGFDPSEGGRRGYYDAYYRYRQAEEARA